MWKAILCGILKSGKINQFLLGYHIQGNILQITLKIPEEHKDIIKCFEEGLKYAKA